MNIGPVKFSVEGTFTEKPRLLMNDVEVDYDSLYISHVPEWEYEDYDGVKKSVAASTNLDFSVKATIGQLEANVLYRVKANEEGNFVLAKVPDQFKKKDKKAKKGGDDKKAMKDHEGKESKKYEEKEETCAELGEARIEADPGSSLYHQYWREDLAKNLAK